MSFADANNPILGTHLQLSSSNPIALNLQTIEETDTGLIRIGDGIHSFNQLAFNDPDYEFTTASGTNTYIADFAMPNILGYFKGLRLRVIFSNSNTEASTISLNSFSAVNIVKNGSIALTTGDILAGIVYTLVYDGVSFQISGNSLNPNPLAGSGTTNISTKWTSSSLLGNGSIYDNGIYSNSAIPLGLNNPTPAAWLHSISTNNTFSTYSLRADSSTVNNMFWVRDDGWLNINTGFYLAGLPFIRTNNNGAVLDSLYIGWLAGANTTLGDAENLAVGYNSLNQCNSGSSNVALGTNSGSDLTTGTFCMLIGRNSAFSGAKHLTGSRHICIGGLETGKDISSGFDNICLGYQSGVGISTGSVNTVIGDFITYTSGSISNTLCIGFFNTMDTSNDAVIGGSSAFVNFYLGGGKYNNSASPIIIQPSSCLNNATNTSVASNTMTIAGARGRGTGDGSPIIFSTAPAGSSGGTWNALVEAMRINTSQQVGINTTSPSERLTIAGRIRSTNSDIVVESNTRGFILKDTQSTPHYWRISISILGILTTTDLGITLPAE